MHLTILRKPIKSLRIRVLADQSVILNRHENMKYFLDDSIYAKPLEKHLGGGTNK